MMPQSIAEQLQSIPMSPNLGDTLERAHHFARGQAHRLVTLQHFLLALTEDPEAAVILQSANVDFARLRAEERHPSYPQGYRIEDLGPPADLVGQASACRPEPPEAG